MKSKKVISKTVIPTYPGKMTMLGAIVWLYLDRYSAPGWLIGSVGTVLVLALIGLIIEAIREKEEIPVFRSDLEETESKPFQKLWNRGKMS